MTIAPFRNNRVVVPRWRPLSNTVEAGELFLPRKALLITSREPSIELKSRLAAWRASPDTLTGSEVLETAIVEGYEDEAVRPARILIAPGSTATPLVREQAALILRRTGHGDELELAEPAIETSALRRARSRTRSFPHDAYGWVDLALAYTIHGKNDAAERSMLVALQLAAADRHVLRSAARLFLHRGEEDRAHDLLRKSEATRNDPWLMAGEIALSALAERKPVMYKLGTKFVEDGGVPPRHLSELASAIGTVHLWDGNRKARKLFKASLIDPTGNSLAQAQWANPHISNLVKPDALARVQDSAEARVFQAYWNADFPEIIRGCEAWQADEPFSSRPHQFGSGIAITIERFEIALKFADDGLRINPDATVLLNNRAYALIALGRQDEASSVLSRCLSKFSEETVGPMVATAGMLAFRLGQFKEGVKRYRQAISLFKRSNNSVSVALGFAYFAQEAARAELPDAPKIIQEAEDVCKDLRHLPEAHIVLNRAKLWLKATEHRKQLMAS
jgi:tetratricopeptide (TPR) repeat protein